VRVMKTMLLDTFGAVGIRLYVSIKPISLTKVIYDSFQPQVPRLLLDNIALSNMPFSSGLEIP
jgi:hypothetical protein